MFLNIEKSTIALHNNKQERTIITKQNEILNKLCVSNRRNQNPNCEKIFYEAMKLKKKRDRLQKRKNTFKARAELSDKFATVTCNSRIK